MVLAGIYQILHTPFTDSGDIDWESFERQIKFCLDVGVHGLVVPAMASEFFSLSDGERLAVTEFAAERVVGHVPFVVGVQAITLPLAMEFAEHAVRLGANALMAMPPYLRKASKAEVMRYYQQLATFDTPIIVQNAPAPVGTPLSPTDLAELLETAPGVRYIKEETPPILQRISQIQAAAGQACEGIFGGANGLYLIDELNRGACGNMPAGGVVDIQIQIYELYRAGNIEQAETLHFQLLPLLTYAAMYGVAFHKFLLWRRGVLNSPYARDLQKATLDSNDIRAIEHLWARVEDVVSDAHPYSKGTN